MIQKMFYSWMEGTVNFWKRCLKANQEFVDQLLLQPERASVSSSNSRQSETMRNVLKNETSDWKFKRSVEFRDDIRIGDWVEFSKTINDNDVKRFALSSGDINPLHLNDKYASKTRFKKRIVHGTLVSGLISSALARFPGDIIYLSMEHRFLAPVEIGETLTARCEVVEEKDDDQYVLKTNVYDEDRTKVLEGTSQILIDPLPDEWVELKKNWFKVNE